MCSSLRERYPDHYHPRGKDVLLIDNQHHDGHDQRNVQATNRNIQATATYPPTQINSTHNQYQPALPNAHPHIIPTRFIPLPSYNQPFLPPSARIPSTFTRPAALLPHPWPKGYAHQQRPVAPSEALQHPAATPNHVYPITSFVPPVFPVHAAQYSTPTYAQVANPQNYTAWVNPQMPLQYQQRQNQPAHSNQGNAHSGMGARNRSHRNS